MYVPAPLATSPESRKYSIDLRGLLNNILFVANILK